MSDDLRQESLLDRLDGMLANLDAHIERRAQELAQPLIAKAREAALTDIERARHQQQRAEDLVTELRRQIRALDWHRNEQQGRADKAERSAEQTEAAIDRARDLAHRLKVEAEQGLQSAVLDSQTVSWRTSAHTAGMFLAALDTDPGREPASPRHTGREEVPHAEA